VSVFDEAAFQRQQLGQALRDLRQRTGLSGLRFANRVGLAQSKVSRVELGQQVPSTADLDRWLDATGAPDDRRAELDRLREAAATEALAWRRQRARGLPALQLDVAAVEASARVLRYWHPTLVPGLLQTPAYARAVYEAMHGPDQPDLAATVAQRMDRQALLYEEGRRFEFIIGEAALRWRFGSRDVMLGQLDRIGVVTGLPNVTTGILPLDAELPVWRTHHFTVYDEREEGPLVHVELLVEGRNYRDPDDVARFQAAFQQLHKVAITGRQTHRLLAQIADTLRTSGTAARGA
jgi:transcriptional regulator with XRE-family HTH domain